jgi:hypothetical protein
MFGCYRAILSREFELSSEAKIDQFAVFSGSFRSSDVVGIQPIKKTPMGIPNISVEMSL